MWSSIERKQKIITKFIGIISIVVFISYWFIRKVLAQGGGTWEIIAENTYLIGWISTANSIVFIIWVIFDRYIWKWRITQIHKWPEPFCTPVLSGRWEGFLYRLIPNDKEGLVEEKTEPHRFVLEINQKFTGIYCSTFSTHSSSKSIHAELLTDGYKNFEVLNVWQSETTNTVKQGDPRSNIFYGTSILKYNPSKKSLNGYYYSNRSPRQTKGEIDLTYVGKKCANSFECSLDN